MELTSSEQSVLTGWGKEICQQDEGQVERHRDRVKSGPQISGGRQNIDHIPAEDLVGNLLRTAQHVAPSLEARCDEIGMRSQRRVLLWASEVQDREKQVFRVEELGIVICEVGNRDARSHIRVPGETAMSKLRLGVIAEEKPVKMTIELSGPLARSLAEYAEVHAAFNGLLGPMPVERLLPAIAERFIATDRALARLRRKD